MSDMIHGTTTAATLDRSLAMGRALALGAEAARRPLVAAVGDVIALTKPRITAMAAIVAAGAMLLAPGTVSAVDAVLALLGITMAVAGAGALNMLVERDVDVLMERTRERPLASRRMGAVWGLLIGSALSFGALPLLWVVGGPLTCALTAFSLFVYVLVYTPMKRTSPWALLVGAVPGAMPALMGSSVVTQRFDIVGVALFAFVLVWQIPHFLAIAIYREREYVAAGHKVVPAVWGMSAARGIMLGSALLLAATGIALWPLGLGGPLLGGVAIVSGVAFVVLCLRGLTGLRRGAPARRREDADVWAREVFRASLVYQTVLFAALAADRLLSGALS
jgi:heme o synthase